MDDIQNQLSQSLYDGHKNIMQFNFKLQTNEISKTAFTRDGSILSHKNLEWIGLAIPRDMFHLKLNMEKTSCLLLL